METASISYRVADFLKRHPPFHAVDDGDLLKLTAQGRVRFHEPNEYILWQGEPHKVHVFVIQQGTVSLWDEAGPRAELRDVRGPGDMLGLERYNGARSCAHSARSESDVVLYAFPADDFEACVLKYPHASQYVAAEGRVTPDYQPGGGRREPHSLFVHDLVGGRPFASCHPHESIAAAAGRLLQTRAMALAVRDAEDRVRAVLTADTVLNWVAAGGGDAGQPVEHLARIAVPAVRPDASVADAVLAMGTAGVEVLAMTADGAADSPLQALVTPGDLASLFGDHPAALLREIRAAASVQELRELNHRSRAFLLKYLTGAASVEWLARFAHLIDVAIVMRINALIAAEPVPGCWCFCSSSGRAESLTALAPHLLVILGDGEDGDSRAPARRRFHQVIEALEECGYLPRLDLPHDADFHVACASEWKARYRSWVSDPIMERTYRARALFDVRRVYGPHSLWQDIEAAVTGSVDSAFLHVLANDCLDSLPPLTFFQDAVVDTAGERSATFRLERSALRPLVDVGRVFGIAARQVMGRSTLERFAAARGVLPEHEAIFREASDTLRIVLCQQGRVGISQATRGADVPPALLSRHDQRVLQSGFRSILRLLEFTADRQWIDGL